MLRPESWGVGDGEDEDEEVCDDPAAEPELVAAPPPLPPRFKLAVLPTVLPAAELASVVSEPKTLRSFCSYSTVMGWPHIVIGAPVA